jgi:hypothetical protein
LAGSGIDVEGEEREPSEREDRPELEELGSTSEYRWERDRNRADERDGGRGFERAVLGDEREDDPWDERQIDPEAGSVMVAGLILGGGKAGCGRGPS